MPDPIADLEPDDGWSETDDDHVRWRAAVKRAAEEGYPTSAESAEARRLETARRGLAPGRAALDEIKQRSKGR